jgi:hypothetical protein
VTTDRGARTEAALPSAYHRGCRTRLSIGKAEVEMGKAANELALGKPDAAVDRYKAAWKNAEEA